MKAFLQRSISLWVVVSMALTQAVPSGFATEGVEETGDGRQVAVVTEEELLQREESAQKQPVAEKETTAHEEFFGDDTLGEATDETVATDQDKEEKLEEVGPPSDWREEIDEDAPDTRCEGPGCGNLIDDAAFEKLIDFDDGMQSQHNAREQGFWNGKFDEVISDILGLSKDAYKVSVTQGELDKLRIICMGPGCASGYDVTIETSGGKTYDATVSMSWDHQWSVRVGDETLRGGGEQLIDQLVEIPTLKMSPEIAALNAMARNLGIDREKLNAWYEQGLIKIDVFRTFFGNFMNVSFDKAIPKMRIDKSEVNPLGDLAFPPLNIFMAFHEDEDENFSGDERFFIKRFPQVRITDMDIQYDKPQILGENDGRDLSVKEISVEMDDYGDVKNVRLKDENGDAVKEVEFSRSQGCHVMTNLCSDVWPRKNAMIGYAKSEGIVRRYVSFNIRQFNILQDDNAEHGDILLVNDFIHDADGKEVYAMSNKFIYERSKFVEQCRADERGLDCPKDGSYLNQIIRTKAGDGSEDGSSTIQLFVNNDINHVDGRAAQITLADGSVHAIEAFDTLEDLFEQVAAIEAKHGPKSKLDFAAKKFDELLNGIRTGGVRLEEVLELRKLLGGMKDLLEVIRASGDESIEKLIEQFEARFNQVDGVVTANLIIIKINGKDVEVNVSEAARVLAEEYQRLSSSDTFDYSRLPGISKDDLQGHETFMAYLDARQVGRENTLPAFQNFSPYGHLTLIAALMRTYGDKVIGGNVDKNDFPEADFRIFRRMVNGTQQSYEQAIETLRKVLSEHDVIFPRESTLKMKDFAALAAAMDTLQGAIRAELKKVIDAYAGEEGFKRQLVQEINMKVQETYNPIVNAWNQIVQTRDVEFEIEGVGKVIMTAAELNDLTWDLPRDAATLLRYPGIQAGLSKEILLSLDSSKAENARNYIDLFQSEVYGQEGVLSQYGTRIQLTERFLQVYGSKVVENGRVNRDNYREALLMNEELRQLLDLSVGMIDVAIEKAKTLGADAKDGIRLQDYEAIMALISKTNEASTAVLKLALDTVIYSVRNEITARLQERFNKLLNVADGLINGAKIKVAIDGQDYLLDPKEFHAAMKEALQRVAVTYGDFTREQYARLAGVTPEFLASLRDASDVNSRRYINFNTYYRSPSGGLQQTPAQEEMWFRLIPSLIEKMGTAVVVDGKVSAIVFHKHLLMDVKVPVDSGKSILGVFTDLVNTLIGEAMDKINKADFSKWSERENAEAVIHEVLKMLQDKANPLIQGLNDQEIAILNQLANHGNYNWNQPSLQKLAQLVDQKRAAAPIVTVTMADGKTIRMDMRAILNIPGFPSGVRFDRELFPGIQDSDLANTERMQNRYITLMKIPAAVDMAEGTNLTALGREQLAVHILQRLYKSGEAGKIFTAEGEVNVEALRRFLKGVDALQAQINAQVEKWVKEAAGVLANLKTEPMTIEAIQAIYAHVTGVRAKILEHMNALTQRHEREDVLEMEEDVTATYQTLIDSMVDYVQTHDLVIKHDGKAVVLPVQDVTKRMLAVLKERYPDADLGAHHFASFFGVNVSDLRRYNKLEEFLGDQIIALPRNSQYMEVISKLSEIGMMELINDLVKRFAKEGVVKDGVVDVDRLMELISDPKAAVEWARKKAVDMYTETREKLEALELPLTSKSFQELTDIVNQFKLNLINDMNDHITSFTQAMFDEIQTTVTQLYGKIQIVRNNVITAKPIRIEARDGTVFELDLKALEPKALEQIMLLLDTTPKTNWNRKEPLEPVFAVDKILEPVFEFVFEMPTGSDVAVKAEAQGQIEGEVMEAELLPQPVKQKAPIDRIKPMPIYRPIWYPFPTQFNPEDTLTQFGFFTLLVKLAEKYGSFAVDAEGNFSAKHFLKELGRTDEERAQDKFNALQKETEEKLRAMLPESADEAVNLDKVAEIHAFLDKAREQFMKTYQLFPKSQQQRSWYYNDPIGNIANAAWSAVMGLYEKQLFSRDIIISTDHGDVTMNGKELVNILMEEYREGHTAFAESYVKDGETSWAYNDYKVLVNTWSYGYYGRGLPYLEQYGGVALGDDEKTPSLYPFNLGDLNRLPGISEDDLGNLDVESKNQVKLTISDAKVLLKGSLNMRVFAPGSGVQTIGSSKSASLSGAIADTAVRSSSLSMKADVYYIDDWNYQIKVLNWLNNSNRDLMFRAIPAMIRDYASLFTHAGKVDADLFRKLLRGESQEQAIQQAGRLAKALDGESYDVNLDGEMNQGDVDAAEQAMHLAIIFQKSLKDSVRKILDRNQDGKLDKVDAKLILQEFEDQIEQRRLLRGLVITDLAKMTGLTKEELENAILSIDVTYDKEQNATITVHFNEGQMDASRLIGVLEEGKLPNSIRYQLNREVLGQTESVPPSYIYGETRITSSHWDWKTGDRQHLLADVYYEKGRVDQIQWTSKLEGLGNNCKEEYCPMMWESDMLTFLHRDQYKYPKDGTIVIERGNFLISKPMQIEPIPVLFGPISSVVEGGTVDAEKIQELSDVNASAEEVVAVSREFTGELTIAQPQFIITLKKMDDGKFYINKLKEGFGTERGVVTTDFIYVASMCRGLDCKPNVFLSSLTRHTEDNRMLSSAQIEDSAAKVKIAGPNEPTTVKVSFNSFDNLLVQIRDYENKVVWEDPQTAKLRKLISSDLVNTFGFDSELVDKLFKKGLLKIKVDLPQSSTATLVIDPSVELPADARNLANLLGSNELPGEIQYGIDTIEPPFQGCDPSPDGATCPPRPDPERYLMSASFRMPGADGGQHFDFALSYVEKGARRDDQAGDNRLRSVQVTQIDDPCGASQDCKAPATLTQVKEITYHWSGDQRGCQEGENCLLGFIDEGSSQDSADIKYFNDKNIVRRTVTFNSGRLMTLNVPTGAVLSVEEFILNADGKEEFYARSEFNYGRRSSHDKTGMPVIDMSPEGMQWSSIVRTNAKGEVLSKIAITQVDRIEPSVWEGEGHRFAIVSLPNGGGEHSVRFDTMEQLLLKAHQLEIDEVAQIAKMRQSAVADLIQLTGLTEAALKKLIESIDVDMKQKTVSIRLKKGKMENGRQLAPMDKGNLPETLRYDFKDGKISQAMLLWRAQQEGMSGRLMAQVNYDDKQRIQNITWQDEPERVHCPAGAACIAPAPPRDLYRDSYTHGKDIVIRREFDKSAIGHPEIYPSDAVDFNETTTLRKMKDGRHYVVRHESRGTEVSMFSYQDTRSLVALTKIKRETQKGGFLSDTRIAGYKAVVRLRSGKERQMMIIGLSLGQLLDAIRQIEKSPLLLPAKIQDYFRAAALSAAQDKKPAATGITTQREAVYQNTQAQNGSDTRLNLASSTTTAGTGATVVATSSSVTEYLQELITGEKN